MFQLTTFKTIKSTI